MLVVGRWFWISLEGHFPIVKIFEEKSAERTPSVNPRVEVFPKKKKKNKYARGTRPLMMRFLPGVGKVALKNLEGQIPVIKS